MTQTDKELLLKDLCSRLPYGVKAEITRINWDSDKEEVIVKNIKSVFPDMYAVSTINTTYSIRYVKPYLFPLSSMTEEQKREYHELIGGMFGTSALINFEVLTDFFNKNHLDYRGLIPMGLALDATVKNIY